ncbi:MAG: hypothetical protein ACPGWR_09770 [Ardenticatenaceae bacterium]
MKEISDCGLRIADCGLRIADRSSCAASDFAHPLKAGHVFFVILSEAKKKNDQGVTP